MRDLEFQAREKKVQKMSRDGLVEQNRATGEEQRISGRLADVSFGKEHTADTALLAHALCLIARNITHTGADIRPDTVAAAALYHDAPEILTGDMPTPVKYKNEALRTAYKAVERESALAMADLLPPELHEIEGSYLTGSVLNDAERKLLKAADRLSALIKCMEEVESGNREFTAALAQQKADLAAMHSPEADYFIEHMLPCYTQNLDELTKK